MVSDDHNGPVQPVTEGRLSPERRNVLYLFTSSAARVFRANLMP